MSATNRTRISNIVKAANTFYTRENFKDVEPLHCVLSRIVPMNYQYGIFAEQDVRILQSRIWSLRSEYVGLQYVADKPLADRPQEGSMESNDTGREDEYAVEREKAKAQIRWELAVLERHLEQMVEQAYNDLEEAGKRDEEGQRARFVMRNKPYYHSLDTTPQWLDKQLERAAPGTGWYNKLLAAKDELVIEGEIDSMPTGRFFDTLPLIDADTALTEYKKLMTDEALVKASKRGWADILDQMDILGQEAVRHEQVMAALNTERTQVLYAYDDPKVRKPYQDLVERAMADETSRHRKEINRPLWLISERFKAIALLAHTGVPAEILDSPEWKTAAADRETAQAQAKIAEVAAKQAQMAANNNLMMANMGLQQQELQMKQMQMQFALQMQQMQKQMDEQMAAFSAQMAALQPPAPAKAPKAKAPKLTQLEVETEKPAEQPASTKAMASGFVHTTRGRARSSDGPRAGSK